MLPSLLYKYCYQSEFGLRIRKTVSHLKQGIYSRDFCPVVKTGEEVYEKLLLLCLVLSLQLPGWQMWRNSRCKSITELEATLCHSSLKLPWLFMQVTAGGARILHHRATHKLHGNWGGGNHQEIQHVEKLQKKILWELEDLEAQISNNHMILWFYESYDSVAIPGTLYSPLEYWNNCCFSSTLQTSWKIYPVSKATIHTVLLRIQAWGKNIF